MLAFVNTPLAPLPVELREVAEPQPTTNEALVEVHAFSLNRGELALFSMRPEGWRPGQNIAGVTCPVPSQPCPTAGGSGQGVPLPCFSIYH